MSYQKVVRVAVNNNFNCTEAEYTQLDKYTIDHPDAYFFVNSNIKTPNLLSLNDHPYKAVITLNPDIAIMDNLVNRLYDIASDKIAFVRIKYVPGWDSITDLIKKVSKTHKVVITMQRFNGKMSISQYVPDYPAYYDWCHNRYRLNKDSSKALQSFIRDLPNISICDKAGLGCGGCGLCSTLTYGKALPIHTLNMSSSGICMFNCTDCYAKTMQHFRRCIGKPVIRFDWIHINDKQKGATEHIRSMKKGKAA